MSLHPHEKKALADAKKEGYNFRDSFRIIEIGTVNQLPDVYTTHAKATKALDKMKDKSKYTIAQIRETIPPVS